MKQIVVSLFSLIGFLGLSQSTSVSISSGEGFNIIPDYGTPDTAIGTKYFNEKFAPARIDDQEDLVFLRYNAFNDEMEYEHGGDMYYLVKEDNLSVNFSNHNRTYQYVQYTDPDQKVKEQRSFLLRLVDGEKSLYKKEAIILIPARETTTGYETPKPAEYKKLKEAYFIKNEGVIKPFPKNKKELLKEFSNKNEQLSDYLKKNKISFSKEVDLIELVSFLNSL